MLFAVSLSLSRSLEMQRVRIEWLIQSVRYQFLLLDNFLSGISSKKSNRIVENVYSSQEKKLKYEKVHI